MCCEGSKDIRDGIEADEFGRDIDRLLHELTCLIDLGVLTIDEEAAFLAVLDDLWALAVRARKTETPADRCCPELSGIAALLAADLDLAYRRLSSAA